MDLHGGESGLTDDHDHKGDADSPGGKQDQDAKSDGDDIGRALRSAYDRTVNEDIPDELLDLLGKLK